MEPSLFTVRTDKYTTVFITQITYYTEVHPPTTTTTESTTQIITEKPKRKNRKRNRKRQRQRHREQHLDEQQDEIEEISEEGQVIEEVNHISFIINESDSKHNSVNLGINLKFCEFVLFNTKIKCFWIFGICTQMLMTMLLMY